MRPSYLFLLYFGLYSPALTVQAQTRYPSPPPHQNQTQPPKEKRLLLWLQKDKPNFNPSINWNTCLEVSSMPPVRDQKSLGICYAFAAATLLDHHRMIMNSTNTSYPHPPLDQGNQISPIDLIITKSNKGGQTNVPDGIDSAGNLLRSVQPPEGRSLELYSERCLSYEKQHENLKNKKTIESCKKIKRTPLSPINLEMCNDIVTQLKTPTLAQSLISRANLNLEPACLKNKQPEPRDLRIPPFIVKTETNTSIEGLRNKIESHIIKNRPVILAYCESIPGDSNGDIQRPRKNCLGPHQVVITGIKKISGSQQGCDFILKVQNSWGKRWQEETNDGWVDGCTLARASLDLPIPGELTWIESPPGAAPTPSPIKNSCSNLSNSENQPDSKQNNLKSKVIFDGPVDGGGLPGSVREP